MIAVLVLASIAAALVARRLLIALRFHRAKKRLEREIIRVQIAIGSQLEEPLRRVAEQVAKVARMTRGL